MIREIKFRQPVWLNGKFHRWHYWGFISSGNFTSPCYPPEQSQKESQQFTGLHDCQGKEIYEGDLVSAAIYADEEPEICTVTFSESGFGIEYEWSDGDRIYLAQFPGSLEVVGNIYENPTI